MKFRGGHVLFARTNNSSQTWTMTFGSFIPKSFMFSWIFWFFFNKINSVIWLDLAIFLDEMKRKSISCTTNSKLVQVVRDLSSLNKLSEIWYLTLMYRKKNSTCMSYNFSDGLVMMNGNGNFIHHNLLINNVSFYFFWRI